MRAYIYREKERVSVCHVYYYYNNKEFNVYTNKLISYAALAQKFTTKF
jgi:hypothetical protein